MGNVSTNRVGKDLCEWGGRDYIALLDDARLMGRRLMERDEEGRREAIIATELDGLFFFFLERRRSWEVSVRNKELSEIIVFCKYYKFKNIF